MSNYKALTQIFDVMNMPKSYLLIPGPTLGTDPRAKIADIKGNATKIF